MKRALLALAAVAAIGGLVWAAQDMGGKDQEPPPMPKASKEHAVLKEGVGTWDYVMKFRMGPDAPEQEIKGVETVTMLGDFWAIFDLKTDDFMGMKWHGHGTLGYDEEKKKYIGTFIENMGPHRMLGEGTMDATGKVLTMIWDGIDHETGKPGKMKEVSERKDKDSGTMTMTKIGSDGKESPMFTITYTRKK
jgi:hypothetical protein